MNFADATTLVGYLVLFVALAVFFVFIHLVMGRFETSEAAEQSLRRFQRQGLVEDAKVTKIPRWTAKGEKTTATGNRRAISL